ncbi:UNVERIFIED_CONTAM: Transcription factor SPATULA [Sesamum latifolium]|uniref:Transcription factor SPATULA n=1 Tax=Sesamum latifolium TaxID=2727402 RepID=A0AAW2XEM3_9LAMI
MILTEPRSLSHQSLSCTTSYKINVRTEAIWSDVFLFPIKFSSGLLPPAAVRVQHHHHLRAENQEPALIPGQGRRQISVLDASSGLNSSSGCSFTGRVVANVSSSSVGNLDNEPDEYDYESERRRSRINEKMKALQNLIPNSNKMLTMRNGLSLYPICLPGMLQSNEISQMRMGIDADKFLNMNMAKTISMDQNISADALLGLQENCVRQAPVAEFSNMESSAQDQFKTFQLSRSSKENELPCQPLSDNCPQARSTGAKATSSIPLETQTSSLKENTLEACLGGGNYLPPNFVSNPIFSSPMNM